MDLRFSESQVCGAGTSGHFDGICTSGLGFIFSLCNRKAFAIHDATLNLSL